MIAALFVQSNGVYANIPDVDIWDMQRDARKYSGPFPVVAHPPCKRWGNFWHGSPSKPHQFQLGEDGGCFVSALAAVRCFNGIIEHPANSRAWAYFGLTKPPFEGGWIPADDEGGWTCCVDQAFYGHKANKRTWLYAKGCILPELIWGKNLQWVDPSLAAKKGYKYAMRRGMISSMSGDGKKREQTPIEFRDILLNIARSAGAN